MNTLPKSTIHATNIPGYSTWQKVYHDQIDQYALQNNVLCQAIAYALSRPSQYLRPKWCMLIAYILANKEPSNCTSSYLGAAYAAVALEMIHTYSLIHDDLPCMDNAPIRRGHPTLHILHNEGIALLAGDALLTDAFSVISSIQSQHIPSHIKCILLQILATCAGSKGMALGQLHDIQSVADTKQSAIIQSYALKTGKLFEAALLMGAYCSHVTLSQEWVESLSQCGKHLGIAYQIYDDLKDTERSRGKPADQDRTHQRSTLLQTYSPDFAKAELNSYLDKVRQCLQKIAPKHITLCDTLIHSCFVMR